MHQLQYTYECSTIAEQNLIVNIISITRRKLVYPQQNYYLAFDRCFCVSKDKNSLKGDQCQQKKFKNGPQMFKRLTKVWLYFIQYKDDRNSHARWRRGQCSFTFCLMILSTGIVHCTQPNLFHYSFLIFSNEKYSRTSINAHLSIETTSLQWPGISKCFDNNHTSTQQPPSTMVSYFYPMFCREAQLY